MVTVTSLDGLAHCVDAEGHELVVDEPEPLGGDRGADPYALMLAALGSCAAITMRLYARTKGWPLERVEVRLRHERVHASDCEGDGRCERVYRRVAIEGPLDDGQRERLLQIAGRCPVARTLAPCVEIVSEE
jgi:putative redox protein